MELVQILYQERIHGAALAHVTIEHFCTMGFPLGNAIQLYSKIEALKQRYPVLNCSNDDHVHLSAEESEDRRCQR